MHRCRKDEKNFSWTRKKNTKKKEERINCAPFCIHKVACGKINFESRQSPSLCEYSITEMDTVGIDFWIFTFCAQAKNEKFKSLNDLVLCIRNSNRKSLLLWATVMDSISRSHYYFLDNIAVLFIQFTNGWL